MRLFSIFLPLYKSSSYLHHQSKIPLFFNIPIKIHAFFCPLPNNRKLHLLINQLPRKIYISRWKWANNCFYPFSWENLVCCPPNPKPQMLKIKNKGNVYLLLTIKGITRVVPWEQSVHSWPSILFIFLFSKLIAHMSMPICLDYSSLNKWTLFTFHKCIWISLQEAKLIKSL